MRHGTIPDRAGTVDVIGPVPIGGIVFACIALLAVKPIRRPHSLPLLSWISTAAPNELPFLFVYIVIASNAPNLLEDLSPTRPTGSPWSFSVLTVPALLVVARRHLRAAPALHAALERGAR